MRFRGAIDEVRVYRRALSLDEVRILGTPQTIGEILAIVPGKRIAGQQFKLRAWFLATQAVESIQSALHSRNEAARALSEFRERLPTVMVMEEMLTPRETHVLLRGQYDKPGEKVEPEVPHELPPMRASAPRNRMGLAEWLVAPTNPLTSRVLVNRAWQLHFGTGFVKTSEDFGRQGEWPSHLELLDWLATETMQHHWDVKRLHRLIVTSSTFRQSSRARPEMTARDPDNRLLAHGPRLRLSAEMVRDQALFASGQLVEQLGGPSVRPYQPAGLWTELTGGDDYQLGQGAELVRRSLYTFWKRTIPPPSLATFDAPTREFCSVKESRTNTPLQALALMNEPTYVAAAEALANRILREANTPAERISRAMLHVIGRQPNSQELDVLSKALERYRFRNDELAAYTLVCGTIMNLDEAVTRQ